MVDNPTTEEVGRSRSPSVEMKDGGASNGSRSRSPAYRSVSRSRSPSRRRRGRSTSPSRSLSRSPVRRRRRRTPSRSRSRSVSPRRSSYRSRRDSRRSRYSRSPSRDRRSRRPQQKKDLHGTREAPEPSKVLGIFGLNMHTRERDLEDVFSKFGALDAVTVVYDHRAKRSRGFGFVYFVKQEDATRAREETNGMDLDGRTVRVDFSVTHRAHSPTPGEYMGEKRPDNGRGYERSRRYSRSPPRRRRRSRSRSWSR
ncbi:hypothetical protein BC941DRAFT_440701 [Chlamydoabsidia padenii]|nr:hypothetical protein BC941DRAFT_440701 [Chlamydoabsidia padenii]